MRKLLIIFFKLIIGFIAIIIVVLLGFILYLETSSNKIASDEQWDTWEEEIKKTPELPPLFYEVYENMHPEVFDEDYKYVTIGLIQNKPLTNIPKNASYLALFRFEQSHWVRFSEPIVALELEERIPNKKLFDYLIYKGNFNISNADIEKACLYYFHKNLKDLSEKEVATLLIMEINPSLYNPFKRQNLIDQKLDEYFKTKNNTFK